MAERPGGAVMTNDQLPLDKESMAAGDPGAVGAMELGRQAAPREVKKIASAEDYAALPAGSEYLDPQGQKRFKPVKTKEDYEAIPEGAQYADPSGQLRTKPKYEGIGFTAQTLYDIAHSDKGRRMALEKFYPGKVKEDPATGDLYVEDEGTRRKPGRGIEKATGYVAAEAIPTLGAAFGAMTGGAAGTLVGGPGVGTVAGGVTGGFAGGMWGQHFNDTISALAGTYDPEGAVENRVSAGLAGAAGDVGGRVISAAAPTAKEAATLAGRNMAKFFNYFWGTDPEKLPIARRIAEEGETKGKGLLGALGLRAPGVAVSPSAIFHEFPHGTNVAEILQEAFNKSDTYSMNAERHLNRKGKALLEEMGVKDVESLTEPRAAVSTEAAGTLLKKSASDRHAEATIEIQKALDARRTGAITTPEERLANIEALRKASEKANGAARDLVQAGFKEIDRNADDAIKLGNLGHNAGDVWRSVAESFVAHRGAIMQQAEKMYSDAEIAAGGIVPPRADVVSDAAQKLIEELPEGFAGQHPAIVKRLRDMAGVRDEKTGEWAKEPVAPTWVQLRNLRTKIRQDIHWNDLTSDVRNGTLKYLNNAINTALHSVEGQPGLEEASRMLKEADAFYRDSIGPLNNRVIKNLVKALDSGLIGDPKALLKMAIRDGQTEVAQMIEKVVGPQTWNTLRAFDTKEMLAQSATLAEDGTIDGAKFARQVLDRKANGVLETLHGKEGAAKLEEQARYVDSLRGKLTLVPKPGDTARDVIAKAHAAAKAAEEAGAKDPLGTLRSEMRAMEREKARAVAKLKRDDPLRFLLDPTVGAHAAVDKILGDPDLVVEVARRFPGAEKSPEFQLLQQIHAERFLRKSMEPGAELAKMSEEVQNLLFPGTTGKQMQMLADEMNVLMSGATLGGGRDMSAGMMSRSAVEHPQGKAPQLGWVGKTAMATPVLRAALGKYFTLAKQILTSPSTLRWLEKGLTSRNPADREAARAAILSAMQRGGTVGAGAAEAIYQGQQ